MSLQSRKLQHIKIVLEREVEPLPSSFDRYALPFKALPEIDLQEIDTGCEFFGKNLSFPFVIASMTGGAEKAHLINVNLAKAAEATGVALGLGSMRIILKDKNALESFAVRDYCPSIPLFANLGLVQLNYGVNAKDVNYLIDAIDADGIFLHVNALQEAIQPEGDTNFKGLLRKLERLIPKLKRPVIIKEVGCGIDFATAAALKRAGVEFLDVAGTGGTSWPQVESYRRDDDWGEVFAATGIPTDQSINNAATAGISTIIAGGGIRSGKDIALALMLGADLATAAKPLLESALVSADHVEKVLEQFKYQLRIAMFVSGVTDLAGLSKLHPESEPTSSEPKALPKHSSSKIPEHTLNQ